MSRLRRRPALRTLPGCLAVAALVLTASCSDPGRLEPPPSAGHVRGFGAWVGASSPDRVADFEQWVGRRVTHVHSFLAHSSWDALHQQSEWAFRAWTPTPYQTVFSVPMLVDDGGTLADGARGAYDHHFRRLAELLVKHRQGDAILRLGWELNGEWFPWFAGNDPDAYRRYWRRIVATMRGVAGAGGLRFDFNLASGGPLPEGAYPGDDVVDIIGMDVYDQSFAPRQADPEVRWDDLVRREEGGLDWLRALAARHGKPVSIPEWAVSTGPHVSGATTDNEHFVREMARWIARNNVAYALYFEEDAGGGHALRTGRFPKAASAFRAAF